MRPDRRTFLSSLAAGTALAPCAVAQTGSGFIDLMRPPDRIRVFTETDVVPLARQGTRWQAGRLEISTPPGRRELPITVSAPGAAITRIHLRWQAPLTGAWRFLGDHWERSYGDLEFRGMVPERIMPWYFLATSRDVTHAYGVATGAASFCFWQADPAGLSLWLDVRNGGGGVELGERRLEAARVITRQGQPGEPAMAAARNFCAMLCPRPRLPKEPVYGSNNWYYTYGKGFSAEDIVRDSELLAGLSPAGSSNRPFMLIDMGWGVAPHGAGPMERGNERFPDMPGLAARMKAAGTRPAIWIRPLLTSEDIPQAWRLPPARGGRQYGSLAAIDPSHPDALAHVARAVRGVRQWGFEMIKHDFSTFEILGRWGFQMGADLTNAGWHLADRGRTTAEIVLQLYRTLREASGDALIIGCNTVGHLGAGLFELQRIGDDNSGTDWERTRKMGVNTLAFRMPQHNTFFAADADCVPHTATLPWNMTRQWLDLLARSGTPLFVSADPAALGPEQKRAIRAALAAASRPQPAAEPVNWLETTCPDHWRFGGETARYDWFGDTGAHWKTA